MSDIENPFLDRGPVREPAQFFGHRGEVRKLAQAVGARAPQTVSITGERRIGKTSLLNFLSAPDGALTEFSHLLSRKPDEYLFVRADLSALKTRELENGPLFFFRLLFRNLDKAAREKTGQTFPIFEQYWRTENLPELVEFGLGGYLDEIQRLSPNLAVIFLLDEADALIRQGVGTLLRSLIQLRPVAFVICTRMPLAEIEPKREVSPLFNMLAETITLGPLTSDESRLMVTSLVASAGQSFAPLEMDFILRAGGLRPDFTRIAARRVLEAKELSLQSATASDGSGGEITQSQRLPMDYGAIFVQVADDLEPACRNLWDGMSAEEQSVCERLRSVQKMENGESNAVQTLKRKGVISVKNTLFSPIFVDFLSRQPAPAPDASAGLRFGEGYITHGDFVTRLSPIELKLLQYLHERAGQVCTRDDIHMTVWGSPYTENDAVKINITVQRMKQKLDQLAEMVEAVRGVGYRWRTFETPK